MAIVLAVMLPQFRNVQNSWSSRQGGADALQSGRILTDHLQRNLAKAVRVTAVSAPSQETGYIEYEAADGAIYRYQLSAGKFVEFGPVGSLVELAGPVGRLQFVCYDAYDLDTPITETPDIRVVRVRALLTNPADAGRDKPFETLVYLRSNVPCGIIVGPSSNFGITTGNAPALAAVDAEHYLCAFTGQGDDGYAVVLTVDTASQTVSAETPFEYDTTNGVNPALAQIDATRYLCVYTGPQGDGYAVILRVDTAAYTITRGAPEEFEGKDCITASLARIDAAHFICAYTGPGSDGYAVILKVDPAAMTVQYGAPYEFDTANGQNIAVKRLDSEHFLCVYQGWAGLVSAAVLRVDTSTLTVTLAPSTPLDASHRGLGLGYGNNPALAQIDETRFLCTYSGNTSDGMAVVIRVQPVSYIITRYSPFQYDSNLGKVPAVIRLADNTRFLCAYQGYMSRLWAAVLVVDPATWNISKEHTAPLSSWKALKPDLARIDDYNYLCVHEDQVNTGWGLILNVGGVRP